MEWRMHIIALAALALGILPFTRKLSSPFAGANRIVPGPQDIWADPSSRYLWWAKFSVLVLLANGLAVASFLYINVLFMPSL
jgi:hypothetical protein